MSGLTVPQSFSEAREPGGAPDPSPDSGPRPVATALEARWLARLQVWLEQLQPSASLPSRIDQLAEGMDWLRKGDRSLSASLRGAAPSWELTRRFRLLIQTVESDAARGPRLVSLVRSVLCEVGGTRLFETGIPNDRGFLGETADRLARRLLPAPRDDQDLGELVFRLFPSGADAAWLRELPIELISRFAALLENGAEQDPFARGSAMVRDALALLAMRASALGLTSEIRARSEPVELRDSPFFQLSRICDPLLDNTVLAWPDGLSRSLEDRISACREMVPVVLRHLEDYGVSVDVVYRVEVITRCLDRLGALSQLITVFDPLARLGALRDLLADLVDARVRDRSLRDLTQSNLRLIARKVIERAGETGEHYITATRREYWRMLASAGGGGALTTFTTALKYLIGWGHFPLFIEGAFSSANYALSFLVMQLLGFTLATKQPSMTAAALANALRGSSSQQKLDDMVSLVARITRSQLAAAAGNILCVIPAAIAFNALYRLVSGHPFLDEQAAHYTLHSVHPLASGTLFFATLTGAFLWLSSVGAGALENWTVYRRLPQALADSPLLRRLIGIDRSAALGRWLPRNVSGIGGSVTLGILLGMMPVSGKFLGLPLEVRHVTLSTGAVTLAVCSLGIQTLTQESFLFAASGIAIIGTLNFGVSFLLALWVAFRAREVDAHWRLRLLGAVFNRLRRAPWQFVFPPKSMMAEPGSAPPESN